MHVYMHIFVITAKKNFTVFHPRCGSMCHKLQKKLYVVILLRNYLNEMTIRLGSKGIWNERIN